NVGPRGRMSQGARAGPAQPKSPRSARRSVLRTKLGLATAPPWLRAPLLLVRYPGLLLAIGSSLVILSVAGASSPSFISSAGITTQVTRDNGSSQPRFVRLYTRPNAFSHVQSIASAGGAGVWLPESAATALRVHPGDSVKLTNLLGEGPRSTKVRVSTVYRDL